MMSESDPVPPSSSAPARSATATVLAAADAAADSTLEKFLAYTLSEREREVILPELSRELEDATRGAAERAFAHAFGVSQASVGAPGARAPPQGAEEAAAAVKSHVDELVMEAVRQLTEEYMRSDEERERRRWDAGEMGVVEAMEIASVNTNPVMLQQKILSGVEDARRQPSSRGWFDGALAFLDRFTNAQANASFHNFY